MPYIVSAGEKVLLVDEAFSCREVTFETMVSFEIKELVSSPLEEHNGNGINPSPYDTYPWGFNVAGKWDSDELAKSVRTLYAMNVYHVGGNETGDATFENVNGSGKNIYTLDIVNDRAVKCSCRGFRFKQMCKHTKARNRS